MRSFYNPDKSSALKISSTTSTFHNSGRSSENHTNTTGVYRRHQQHQQSARKQRAQLTALIDQVLQWSIEELTFVEADMIEKMLNEALEPNERMTFILSSMQSLSIIDSSNTRACSSSHFLQTMMNRSVLLLEIMNGKYFEVQDFFLQHFARKSLSCSKSWHWPINLKLGLCTSHNILNSLLP
jgi:hypothetical protein